MKGWLKPKHGAKYSDVGERTYRTWFKKGLRSVRIRGIVLSKVEWIDDFLQKHEVGDGKEVDRIVSDLSNSVLSSE